MRACARLGVETVLLEASTNQTDLLSRPINEIDVYIAVIGFRYGYVPPDQENSITQLEFERAGALGIPRMVFLMSDHHPVRPLDVDVGAKAEKLAAFKSSIRQEQVVREFRSPEDLEAAIITDIVQLFSKSGRKAPPNALLLLPRNAMELRTFLSIELERRNVRVLQLDEMLPPGAIWANAISDAIQLADLVLVDVTDANPNLMYELGYAHALKKPTIILVDSDAGTRVPSDLAGVQYLTYSPSELDSLLPPIDRLLRTYVQGASR